MSTPAATAPSRHDDPDAGDPNGVDPGGVDPGGVAVFPRPDAERSVATSGPTTNDKDGPHDGGSNSGGAAGGDRKPFLYASLPDWYTRWLARTIERRMDATGTGTLTWCPQWWAHPEVIARLEALWRAWEVARHQDGEAPTRWFAHLDANLKTLMDAKLGPMADCGPDTHRRYGNTRPLPDAPAPAGWWGTATDTLSADSSTGGGRATG